MQKKFLFLSLIASFSTLVITPVVFPAQTQSLSFLLTQAQNPNNLNNIAKNITVRVYADDISGSGVLISKKGQVYTIITNAHVVRRGETYRIQTPDGVIHQAVLKTAEDAITGKDLALLQFESSNNYTLVTPASDSNLKPDQMVLAAGFPYDSQQLSITEGKITLITEKPIQGGYQIGFSNPTQQGMSGGVLLNQKGELIGILGKGNAILTTAYDYEDGTSPDATILKQMQQSNFAIPVESVNFLTKLYEGEETEVTIPRQVDQIAEKITVRVDTPTNIDGSGVIVGKNGQTYYILTAHHVVQGLTELKIVTPDNVSHTVKKDGIKTFEGIDVAVLTFTSANPYSVAVLADYPLGRFSRASGELEAQDTLVFLSGFPNVKSGNPSRKLSAGVAYPQYSNFVTTKDQYSLAQGAELIYNCISFSGMSGGAVLDQQGRLIGINTGSEIEDISKKEDKKEEIYLGSSLGVPIKTFLGQFSRYNLNPQWFTVETQAPTRLSKTQTNQILLSLIPQKPPTDSSSAVDWVNYGRLQSRLEQHDQAIKAYDQAVARNPQFYQAYYLKGQSLYNANQDEDAITSFAKTLEINPDFHPAWYLQAQTFTVLNKPSEALISIDKALEIAPQEPKFYQLRGIILRDLERDPEAEEALTTAIKLKPNAQGYLNRAFTRFDWGDYEGAIADYTQVIELQPNLPLPYGLRAQLKIQEGSDLYSALQDITIAIQLDPNDMLYYMVRGNLRIALKDYQGAISDVTKAINNPSQVKDMLPDLYYQRAIYYNELKDWPKAIDDMTQTIKLDPKNTDKYLYRGLLYRSLGDRQKEIADYSKALEIKPNYPNAYMVRGETYQQMNQPDKAKRDYQKAEELFTLAIQKAPNIPLNYTFRGLVRRALGNMQGAEEDSAKVKQLLEEDKYLVIEGFDTVQKFRQKQERMKTFYSKAIQADPKNARLYIYRGIVEHNQRNYQAALEDFNQSIQLDSSYPETYYRRGLTYQSLKDYPNALADFNKALELDIFEVTNVYFNRGLVKVKLGDYQGAIQDFDTVIQRQPNNISAWANRTDSYVALQDYPNAIKSLNKLLEIQPNNEKLYTLRGNIYFQNNDFNSALKDYNKAIEINPNFPEAYFGRGVIYQKQSKYDLALTEYQLAVEKNQEMIPAIINIGYIYYEKGDSEAALKQWLKATELDPKLAEPQLAIAVVLYSQGEKEKGLELAKQVLKLDPQWSNIDYLKQNLWGDKLILEAQKLLQQL